MKHRVLTGFLTLAVLLGVSMGLAGIALANHWTPFGTPTENLGWGSDCRYDMLQLIYYENNTASSVNLEKSGHWVRPTGSCDVVSVTAEVIEGDSSTVQGAYNLYDPITYPSSWTAWWDLGEATYYKHGDSVSSFTTAGPSGYDGQQVGWQVIFWPSGSIGYDSLN